LTQQCGGIDATAALDRAFNAIGGNLEIREISWCAGPIGRASTR